MIHYIYALPLRQVWALMIVILLLWSFGQLRTGRSLQIWRRSNVLMLAAALGLIIFTTILRRQAATGQVILIPFYSFVLARRQPEFYREMLMNVLLFFPLGLTLSTVLPEHLRPGRRWGLTVLAGLGMSLVVELIQLVFSLGTAEVDDLLTNVLGTALGATQLLLGQGLRRLKD